METSKFQNAEFRLYVGFPIWELKIIRHLWFEIGIYRTEVTYSWLENDMHAFLFGPELTIDSSPLGKW